MTTLSEQEKASRRAEAEELAARAEELAAGGALEESAEALERAAALVRPCRVPAEMGDYEYRRGQVLARLPAGRERALEAWLQASATAMIAELPELHYKSDRAMIDLQRDAGDLDAWRASLWVLLQWMDKQPETRAWPEFAAGLREQARLQMRDGLAGINNIFLRKAHADFTRAIEAARALGDEALALQLRLERQALYAVMPEGGQLPTSYARHSTVQQIAGYRGAADEGVEGEDFAALRAEAEAAGCDAAALAFFSAVEQASAAAAAGEHATAEARARAAWDSARQTGDLVYALTAAILIAHACEAQEDLAGALAILFACKAAFAASGDPAQGRDLEALFVRRERDWGAYDYEEAVAACQAEAQDKRRRPARS